VERTGASGWPNLAGIQGSPGRTLLVHCVMPSINDFLALEMRVGTVLEAESFPEARKPSIKLLLDFGPDIGHRRSSAQLTRRYQPADLVGRQVVAVMNLGTRRIAGFSSEVLVLGGVPEEGDVVLLRPDVPVPNGTRIA
jgi:tRNA-binding protein